VKSESILTIVLAEGRGEDRSLKCSSAVSDSRSIYNNRTTLLMSQGETPLTSTSLVVNLSHKMLYNKLYDKSSQIESMQQICNKLQSSP